jgi:hypothetical protein
MDLLGNWRGWVKEDEDEYADPGDWKTITTIETLWKATARGEAWATALMFTLNSRLFRSSDEEESTEALLFSG